ncbi:MAG TPA: DegV family protein [Dehalococcoidia bacterium]|nr:DegV family protein [Dehalococcoidia bacterium]
MVKIVTDSTSDIPPQIAEALGITIVPAYVHFGDKSYRDRVDISEDELYRRLVEGPVHPTTSAPSPGNFAEVYSRLARESDEIVAVMLTSKESALYNAALLGKETVKGKCHIEVIDSQSVSMGLGFIAIAAAEAAQAGKGIEEVVKAVRQAIPRTHLLAALDTTKYVLKGGRLGRAALSLGAMLRVKPMLTIREGDIVSAGLTRTRGKSIERLYEFVKKHLPIEDLAIMHSTTPKEAQSLAERLKSLIPRKQPLIARLGPALGVHAGPGALAVALREG